MGKVGAVWLANFGVGFGLGLTGKLSFHKLCMVLLGWLDRAWVVHGDGDRVDRTFRVRSLKNKNY